MNDLFISPKIAECAILLIDSSGSTDSLFNGCGRVYDKMIEIVKNLPEQQFRMLFWSSKYHVYPYVTQKDKVHQTMLTVVKPGGGTLPELAFNNIPSEWYEKNGKTTIYYITDGDIGSGSYGLPHSIKQVVTNNLVMLNILTVERNESNLDDIEQVEKAAGSDIYKLLVSNNLTGYVNKFVSFTLKYPNGYNHINKNTAPNGFVAYESKYFSELRTSEFISFISEAINSSENDDQLLKIIQNLTNTISTLVKDKPQQVRNDIIKNFASLFKSTTIDPMLVNYMLCDSVQKEIIGKASVFASYRSQLKDLYKQASILLQNNVKQAIGITDLFIGFPISGKIITGHRSLVDQAIKIANTDYPSSAVKINNITVPCFAAKSDNNTLIVEQCTRQWTRTIFSKLYNLDPQSDSIIYTVLGVMLKVVLSNVSDYVKDGYKQLATTMLQKKRLNSVQTELEKLESGDLPVPNSGKIEHFYNFMSQVASQLEITLNPFSLWYAICLALNNTKLLQAQSVYCEKDISDDFPTVEPSQILLTIQKKIKLFQHIEIPNETSLDYNCIITLESIEDIGGYKFVKHNTGHGSICCPVYIISERGYNGMFGEKDWTTCPICYSKLTKDCFEAIGPKPKANLEVFDTDTVDKFAFSFKNQQVDTAKKPFSTVATNYLDSSEPVNPNANKIIVVMKGTVGSGKSTYSADIYDYITGLGGYCTVQGTDQYCKNGASFNQAAESVKSAFNQALHSKNDLRVVVVDTCGERSNGTTFFDVDFSGWKRIEFYPNLDKSQMLKYFAWTLRNVLVRNKPTANDNWYLNSTAGVKTCVDVHKKKVISLFNKKDINNFVLPTPLILDDVLNTIKKNADEYQVYLDEKHPRNIIIEKLFSGKI